MISDIFNFLIEVDVFLWYRLSFALIIILGLYFTFKFKLAQITKFPNILKTFWESLKTRKTQCEGIHPLYAFFASIGGCIGIGNVVAICTAVKLGGPGAVFWMWVVAFLGMIIKYSEIYLGIKHRVHNKNGGYNGGPMYFLQKAFKISIIPIIFCLLLCIYGTEIFTFNVVTDSISTNWGINRLIVVIVLLTLVIIASMGGIKRVGKICSTLVPLFMFSFLTMSFWVLINNIPELIVVFKTIFTSAFTGHAAIGAFAGSSIMLTISQGVARACYTGDIGIGYASIVHAESCTTKPEKQASLTIFGIFLDTFVLCTISTLLILVTGTWKEGIKTTLLVQEALGSYFPIMNMFMPFFIFLLGYSTLIAFLTAGLKCAKFLSPKFGKTIYYGYAITAFLLFSLVNPEHSIDYALIVMSIAGALLLIVNLTGIFLLRKEIKPPL